MVWFPSWLVKFVTHALGICTAKKDGVAVALLTTPTDDDVAVGVALCGVHVVVPLCVGYQM
tara:strand:- start:189 stop:371 length:183 start_codon:yes stop_codon:yes gene_type:complete